jgi:hypothetical protein
MELIDLVVLACAIASPNACREYHIQFETSGTLQSCMVQAQPYLARWAGEHPNLKIMRWHCAWPGQEDEHA